MPASPPAGISPASAYELFGFARQVEPPLILADAIDPATGDLASLLEGASLADAFAIEAVRIQRGTGAAVRDVGNRYHELTHVEATMAGLVESLTIEAFADAERAGVAALVGVTIEVDDADPAQVNTVIEYRDMLAAEPGETQRLILSR